MAARAVLTGFATGTPKTGAGHVEMIRVVKLAKDPADRACTQAINQIKALSVTRSGSMTGKLVRPD